MQYLLFCWIVTLHIPHTARSHLKQVENTNPDRGFSHISQNFIAGVGYTIIIHRINTSSLHRSWNTRNRFDIINLKASLPKGYFQGVATPLKQLVKNTDSHRLKQKSKNAVFIDSFHALFSPLLSTHTLHSRSQMEITQSKAKLLKKLLCVLRSNSHNNKYCSEPSSTISPNSSKAYKTNILRGVQVLLKLFRYSWGGLLKKRPSTNSAHTLEKVKSSPLQKSLHTGLRSQLLFTNSSQEKNNTLVNNYASSKFPAIYLMTVSGANISNSTQLNDSLQAEYNLDSENGEVSITSSHLPSQQAVDQQQLSKTVSGINNFSKNKLQTVRQAQSNVATLRRHRREVSSVLNDVINDFIGAHPQLQAPDRRARSQDDMFELLDRKRLLESIAHDDFQQLSSGMKDAGKSMLPLQTGNLPYGHHRINRGQSRDGEGESVIAPEHVGSVSHNNAANSFPEELAGPVFRQRYYRPVISIKLTPADLFGSKSQTIKSSEALNEQQRSNPINVERDSDSASKYIPPTKLSFGRIESDGKSRRTRPRKGMLTQHSMNADSPSYFSKQSQTPLNGLGDEALTSGFIPYDSADRSSEIIQTRLKRRDSLKPPSLGVSFTNFMTFQDDPTLMQVGITKSSQNDVGDQMYDKIIEDTRIRPEELIMDYFDPGDLTLRRKRASDTGYGALDTIKPIANKRSFQPGWKRLASSPVTERQEAAKRTITHLGTRRSTTTRSGTAAKRSAGTKLGDAMKRLWVRKTEEGAKWLALARPDTAWKRLVVAKRRRKAKRSAKTNEGTTLKRQVTKTNTTVERLQATKTNTTTKWLHDTKTNTTTKWLHDTKTNTTTNWLHDTKTNTTTNWLHDTKTNTPTKWLHDTKTNTRTKQLRVTKTNKAARRPTKILLDQAARRRTGLNTKSKLERRTLTPWVTNTSVSLSKTSENRSSLLTTKARELSGQNQLLSAVLSLTKKRRLKRSTDAESDNKDDDSDRQFDADDDDDSDDADDADDNDEDDNNDVIKIEKKPESLPEQAGMTLVDKAVSKTVATTFFNAVDDLVEGSEDLAAIKRERQDFKEYYDSVFSDYPDGLPESGKPESLFSKKNEIDDFFLSSKAQAVVDNRNGEGRRTQLKQITKIREDFGALAPGEIESKKIPGYIDDRTIYGIAETGVDPAASVISRVLVEEQQNDVISNVT